MWSPTGRMPMSSGPTLLRATARRSAPAQEGSAGIPPPRLRRFGKPRRSSICYRASVRRENAAQVTRRAIESATETRRHGAPRIRRAARSAGDTAERGRARVGPIITRLVHDACRPRAGPATQAHASNPIGVYTARFSDETLREFSPWLGDSVAHFSVSRSARGTISATGGLTPDEAEPEAAVRHSSCLAPSPPSAKIAR